MSSSLIHASARFMVRYGDRLPSAGLDLPRPTRVAVETRHGPVDALVYGELDADSGAHVHFHGGAWLMRYPMMDDWWCRYLQATAGVPVVNVDFHAGPYVQYPVAQEECHDVAAWVAGQVASTSIGGFSSGGGLAASVALQARDADSFRPVLQVLGVPALDLVNEKKGADGTSISPKFLALVRRVYFPDVESRHEAYASPLLADDLTGLPPAIVLTAERDILRAEGDAYAERLREAGVPVVHDVTPDADHYFLSADRRRSEATMAMMAEHVRTRLAQPRPPVARRH